MLTDIIIGGRGGGGVGVLRKTFRVDSIQMCIAEVSLYVHKNRRFISDGSPGRPPRFHTAPEL